MCVCVRESVCVCVCVCCCLCSDETSQVKFRSTEEQGFLMII